MSNAPLLQVKGLGKTYPGGTRALDNVSFELNRGEFLVLLGLSGSGKSTLLRCLNRLVEPSQGQVLFNGQEITPDMASLRYVRNNMGMVFQQFNLVKNLSVQANVLSGRLGVKRAWNCLFFTTAEKEEAYNCLERVGLADLGSRQVKNLSGGQQQRVAIARALMQKPKLMLADEPVASLDPATSDSIMHYLGELNNDGISVICSLHFLSLARRYGSRVLALKDGKIVFTGSPQQIDEQRFEQIYGQDARQVELR